MSIFNIMGVTTKLFPSIILLLVLPRELYGQTFDTVGCGTDKGCFASPASCSNSENCNFLITYKATSSSKVEFELSGKGDWVAVGFSDDQNMAGTDILMCVRSLALTGHYYADSRDTPKKTNPTPTAVNITEQAAEGEVIKCRISREINPNPAILNFSDLDQEVFLLAAVGKLSGSDLQQHSGSDRAFSPNKVKVTQANSTVITGSEDPMQQGSFRFPDSCTSSADCDFLVTYQASDENVLFELSGKGNWAGVGFSDDKNMPDTDMLICVSDRALSGHYYAPDKNIPRKTDPTPSAVEITEETFDNGVVKCKISRKTNPEIENFRDLNKEWFLLGAIGPVSGNSIRQHDQRKASSSKIIVTQGGDLTGGGETMILIHGILMTLAWILFAFVGLFTARYMRQVWEPTELLGKKAWFTVHRTLMTITVLLTVAATVVIFVHRKGWSSGVGPHPYCGIIAIAFAVVQPIMAAFRPHPGAPRRNIFNWAHRIVGTIALVMAVVSIYFGLDNGIVMLGKEGLWAVVTFYIGEFLIFLFELYLILSKRNKEKRSVSVTNTGDIQMQPPGHQTTPEPEMSIKEAMIRTMMFVFVVLLGASVALTIILLLVLKYYK